MATAEAAAASGWGFLLKEDLADLLEELGVDVLSLGGLEAGGDGAVTTAAAGAAAEAAAEPAGRRPVVVVAAGRLGPGARYQSQGYALWKEGNG